MINNPFDLANYKRQITMHKENTALKSSYQQTSVINRERAKGIEPSLPYSAKAPATEPTKFVADMPVMPKYDKNAAKRQKTKEKKMLACKHEWLTLADQPLYKCNECNAFMRVEK
tara:strand:+ start:1292 stop:1636 length:345 start_codon:yes stop_codon:yes gene_type:complete